MKVSLNLAQQFSNVDLQAIPRQELTRRIGAQLGAIEAIEDFRPLYEGVVVVRVMHCERHPDADKLSLCLVDDGGVAENVERNSDGYVQVVCGAPNVRTAMYAAWIPPSVSVPSTRSDAEPFVLEARELRGKTSNGMLASEKELAISDNHEGILEVLPEEVGREPKPGEPLFNYYGLDDYVIDCENKMFTHRPDCFGNLGVARELAGIQGLRFISPDWYVSTPEFETADTLSVAVQNEIPELVSRFTVVAMDSVKVGSSPVWLRAALKRVGIKAVNNVVDVTNYVMHLTGQPLHAFDYDKLQSVSSSSSLLPRNAKNGEKLKLLNGKTIALTEADMVIATDTTAVALAGIMGGSDTEVDETTTRIVIECANFDMYAVRRSSMRHGLFTDAVTRFNKGQSPLQNDRVLAFAMKKMHELARATQASPVYDQASFDVSADNLNHVTTNVASINARLGTNLSIDQIRVLLENVECSVEGEGDALKITAPFWRMDIALPEDIVEEVGRLYGYDKVPVVLPPRPAKPASKNVLRVFKHELRTALKSSGANEVLSYSFVHGDVLRSAGIDPATWCYQLRNALSPDLQYYRPSLLPSLLAKVHPNSKAQAGKNTNAFMLYELGKVHKKGYMEDSEPLPKEFHRIAAVYAADSKSTTKDQNSPYFIIKRYIDELSNGQAEYLPLDAFEYPEASPFLAGRSAVVSIAGEVLGVAGEFTAKVRDFFKLPEVCAGFELDLLLLQSLRHPNKYEPLTSYPSSMQDITLEVSATTTWGMLTRLLQAEVSVVCAEFDYRAHLEPISIYNHPDASIKRFSYRLTLSHKNKTLQTAEVSAVLNTLADVANEKLAAKRI